jgi:hypothetical protein
MALRCEDMLTAIDDKAGFDWFDPRTQSGRPVGNNERLAATEKIQP